MQNKKNALYPGSFNPIHKGHLSIIDKASKLFDTLYVVVSFNPDKNNLEDIEKNYEIVLNLLSDKENIKVIKNKNQLTAELAKELNATYLIRSARNIQDYEYELELAAGNKYLNENLETILIMPDYENIEFSSTLQRHKERLK
ncbi:pantetheine-phosphate adenylyltransferase [Mycoplasma sp. Pen4]|uniref:pantetheine-phosphate adenylyltransferase n=1 Tax=Mycoplasma sp. Pen4 TaxID=640330 RepID=UPI0016549240|nr:pantetheine-phosphate adenylyltransferase [Mycoplasma sp. Pen4]QNM93864.1 pantetheine-phosphate adenylyltransferase [Mycoplasma sp. Pen4]